MLCTPVFAGLDEPAQKTITVKSEIERGKDAAFDIGLKCRAYETLKFISQIDDSISYNKQRNTDTDAFYIGIYMQAWVEMIFRLNEFDGAPPSFMSSKDIAFYKEIENFYFKEFREKQNKLEISNDDLLSLFSFTDEFKSKLKERMQSN
jgi:hypothetical protein